MALDLKGLAQRVDDVLPDRVARAAQLTALADSLVYINAWNPSIWLVHVLSDRVRLFAGRLIVLTLQRQSLWVTVEDAKGVDELAALCSWQWDTESYPRYRRPPSRNGFYSPMRDQDQDWQAIQKVHFDYLDRVLASYHAVDPRSAARHEPLIVEYLSIVLGRSMPGTQTAVSSEEVLDAASYWEGSTTRVPVNRFERDRRARDACVLQQGSRCAACGMAFGERYGSEVEGFIHVHHLVPLAEIRDGYSPNPVRDLVPVCPNCHAVIHAGGGPIRSVEQVQKMLRRPKETAQQAHSADG